LATLKHAGKTTLMCGDGTNDVGALKQAHVGIAVLNRGNPPKKRRVKIGDLKGAAKKAAEEKVRKVRLSLNIELLGNKKQTKKNEMKF